MLEGETPHTCPHMSLPSQSTPGCEAAAPLTSLLPCLGSCRRGAALEGLPQVQVDRKKPHHSPQEILPSVTEAAAPGAEAHGHVLVSVEEKAEKAGSPPPSSLERAKGMRQVAEAISQLSLRRQGTCGGEGGSEAAAQAEGAAGADPQLQLEKWRSAVEEVSAALRGTDPEGQLIIQGLLGRVGGKEAALAHARVLACMRAAALLTAACLSLSRCHRRRCCRNTGFLLQP